MKRAPGPATAWLRALVSAGLLALLLAWLEPDTLWAEFHSLAPSWLLLALALSVPQVLVSAWRWRLTARGLEMTLPMRTAVAEYYLATFLNQVLPGGVLGDAARAWRHGRRQAGMQSSRGAWHAVLIERASGQFALLLLVVLALMASPPLRDGLLRALAPAPAPTEPLNPAAALRWAGLAAATALAALAALRWAAPIRAFAHDLHRALLANGIWRQHAVASLAVAASYVAVYFCCARALGIGTPASELLPLIPLVLLAMAVPGSVAGWGLREGAAAAVWWLAGLQAAQGVAISIAYGLLVLLSSLPGALVLVALRRPRPEARGATPGEAP